MDKSNNDDFLKLPQKSEVEAGECDDDPSEYEKMLDKRWLVRETAMRIFVACEARMAGDASHRKNIADRAWAMAKILWESKPKDL